VKIIFITISPHSPTTTSTLPSTIRRTETWEKRKIEKTKSRMNNLALIFPSKKKT
jgi:hypothetical protein